MFGWFGRKNGRDGKARTGGERVGVAFVGDGYRRAYAKQPLEGRVEVAAELASDRRVHLLPEVSPEVIALDCASEGVNPLVALPKLAEITGRPRIVALVDGQGADGIEEENLTETLVSLGADATANIRDAHAVVEAILPGVPRTPRDRRTLAAA